ncbi:MAG: hypothetical protein CMF46_01795 [Legionellales bacterium]|nr:hypothetical protein [Legionellales bacterium]|tara:strand:+ start:1659 stop:2156 length:498 start_codon:yes stop_codon:yes gene_type:complete
MNKLLTTLTNTALFVLFITLYVTNPLYLPNLFVLYLCLHFYFKETLGALDYVVILIISLLYDIALFFPLGLTALLTMMVMFPFSLKIIQRGCHQLSAINSWLAPILLSCYFYFAPLALIMISFKQDNILAVPYDWLYYYGHDAYITLLLTIIYSMKVLYVFKNKY